MKCHKCGYEYSAGSACPKCGAGAILVNEDYLRRKREYEESGKISIGNVEFKKSDDDSEFVEAEDLDPVDVLKDAYKKMKEKGNSVIKNGTKRRTAKRSKGVKKNSAQKDNGRHKKVKVSKSSGTRKADDGRKRKLNKFMSGHRKAVAGILGAVLLAVIFAAAVLVWFSDRNKDCVYLVSDGTLYDDSRVTLLVNDDELYLYRNKKKTVISREKADLLLYNSDFSGVMYSDSEGVNYRFNGKNTRLYKDFGANVIDCFISSTGSNIAYVVYEQGVYVLYSFYNDEIKVVSQGSGAKEILYASNTGNVVYKDIDYSPLNGVNSLTLMYYDGNRHFVSDSFVDAVYVEKSNSILLLSKENELLSVKLAEDMNAELILSDADKLYTQKSNCVYDASGKEYIPSEYNQSVLVSSGGLLKQVTLEDVKTKTINFVSVGEGIIFFENTFLRTENDVLIAENGTTVAKLGKGTEIIYDEYGNRLLYVGENEKLTQYAQGKEKVLSKEKLGICHSIAAGDKIICVADSDNVCRLFKKNGKTITRLEKVIF